MDANEDLVSPFVSPVVPPVPSLSECRGMEARDLSRGRVWAQRGCGSPSPVQLPCHEIQSFTPKRSLIASPRSAHVPPALENEPLLDTTSRPTSQSCSNSLITAPFVVQPDSTGPPEPPRPIPRDMKLVLLNGGIEYRGRGHVDRRQGNVRQRPRPGDDHKEEPPPATPPPMLSGRTSFGRLSIPLSPASHSSDLEKSEEEKDDDDEEEEWSSDSDCDDARTQPNPASIWAWCHGGAVEGLMQEAESCCAHLEKAHWREVDILRGTLIWTRSTLCALRYIHGLTSEVFVDLLDAVEAVRLVVSKGITTVSRIPAKRIPGLERLGLCRGAGKVNEQLQIKLLHLIPREVAAISTIRCGDAVGSEALDAPIPFGVANDERCVLGNLEAFLSMCLEEARTKQAYTEATDTMNIIAHIKKILGMLRQVDARYLPHIDVLDALSNTEKAVSECLDAVQQLSRDHHYIRSRAKVARLVCGNEKLLREVCDMAMGVFYCVVESVQGLSHDHLLRRPEERHVGILGGYTSIQHAIDMAHPGDRVVVHPGSYDESLHVRVPIELVASGEEDSRVIVTSGTGHSTLLWEAPGGGYLRCLTLRRTSSSVEKTKTTTTCEDDTVIVDVRGGASTVTMDRCVLGCEATSRSIVPVHVSPGSVVRLVGDGQIWGTARIDRPLSACTA